LCNSSWAVYISAAAATIAALLTAVNLWLTGRRETLAWTRNALEEAFVDFLNAVYANRQAARGIVNLKEGQWSYKNLDDWWRQVDSSHETMLNCATRMRILASDEMAEAALTLHEIMDEEIDLIAHDDVDGYRTFHAERQHTFVEDRAVFVAKARKFLAIKPRMR
jgi:hypothetical protein